MKLTNFHRMCARDGTKAARAKARKEGENTKADLPDFSYWRNEQTIQENADFSKLTKLSVGKGRRENIIENQFVARWRYLLVVTS
jgi:hypothetical protein